MLRNLGLTLLILSLGAVAAANSIAQEQAGRQSRSGPTTYQRRSSYHQAESYPSSDSSHSGYHRRPPSKKSFHHSYHQSNSFSFQRPYPYHLDYYRMKYGGSYAPYFGNLYGPPAVYAPANVGGYQPIPYGGFPGPLYDMGPVTTPAPYSPPQNLE